MALALTALLVHDQQLGVPAHHDLVALAVLDQSFVLELHLAADGGFDVRLLRATLGSAADVERPHGQLGSWLADRLGRDDTDSLADIHRGAAGKVTSVTLAADTGLRLAEKCGTDDRLVDTRFLHALGMFLGHHLAGRDDDVAGGKIYHVLGHDPAQNAVIQCLDDITAVHHRADRQALAGAAIRLVDDTVLRHIDQTAGQVTRVRGLQRRIGKTLAGAVGRVEIFENVQAFLEGRDDRCLDDLARRLGHKSAHAGKLLDLRRRAAGTGMRHHPDRVDRLAVTNGRNTLHHLVGDEIRTARPDVDNLVVLLALSDQAVEILLLEGLHLGFGLVDVFFLQVGGRQVGDTERDAGVTGLAETKRHQPVTEDDRVLLAAVTVDVVDHVTDLLLGHQLVDQVEGTVRVVGQQVGKLRAARCRLDHPAHTLAILVTGGDPCLDLGVQADGPVAERQQDFLCVGKDHALALLVLALERHVVQAENDVLRRHDDRLAVGRAEDVVGRHHQDAGLELGFQRQRHMDRHLITVEVGVEGGTDQRMKLDGLALDEDRLERLDAKTVQRRRAVQHHRMLTDHLFKDIPDLGTFLFHHALGHLHGAGHRIEFQLRVDEGLEQLQRHLLGQAALVQLQLGTDNDHRTAGIVDALAEQVLAETALLALQHVGKRLQRALVDAADDTAAAAIVEQRVDGLLQHPLLVPHDDVRRAKLDQALQAVVPVDHTAIQVVQVGGGEPAAIQRNQRAQLGRNDRDHIQDHPFRTAA